VLIIIITKNALKGQQRAYCIASMFLEQGEQYELLMVEAIPLHHLDRVRTWLNGLPFRFYEFNSNLDWRRLLRSVNKDLQDFHAKVSMLYKKEGVRKRCNTGLE
jgi:nucleosome binding factor SPN SPT16 subunit